MEKLIKPKDVTIKDLDGEERRYIISRFPAVDGRRIIVSWVGSAASQKGEKSEVAMRDIMRYVAVETGDTLTRLTTQALIDNHVPDSISLLRLEAEIMDYNTGFSKTVGSLDFWDSLTVRAQDIGQKLMPMLTDFLQSFLAQDSQPSQS